MLKRNFSITPTSQHQFNQLKLVDNGDLPLGDIPEILKYDRPFEMTTISNGIKVMTEPS